MAEQQEAARKQTLWNWLKDPDNRENSKVAISIISLVFTGVCGLIMYVLEQHFASNKSTTPRPESTQRQTADCGGIVAGRDATGNTVTCNHFELTAEQLKELIRGTTATVSPGEAVRLQGRIEVLTKRLGVSEDSMRTLLKKIVGEQPNISDEELPHALEKVASQYKSLQLQVDSLNKDDPLARALVLQVQTEITAGRLRTAGELLQKITRYVATLNGTCARAQMEDVPIDAKSCLQQLLNTEYRDGRIAFTFTARRGDDLGVFSFSGNGTEQFHHVDKESVLQPIDKIVFTFKGHSDSLQADGSCSFSNVYKGTPSKVSCTASTIEGRFSGDFMTDGTAPNLFEAGAGAAKQHSNASPPQVIGGSCDPSSHIAEGLIDEDLTKRQSRFFCTAAVMASFDDDPGHRMIQFAPISTYANILAFAGLMENAAVMKVQHVYFKESVPTEANDGFCKFYYEMQKIKQIFCGAKVDEGDRRTVAIVTFTVGKTSDSEQR